MKKQQGLGKIELIIIVFIMGFIFLLETPSDNPIVKKIRAFYELLLGHPIPSGSAKITAAKLQIQRLAEAVQLFNLDTGRYPTSIEGLQAVKSAPGNATK